MDSNTTEIEEFLNFLIEIENDLYGSVIYIAESNTIEWCYDGLGNPNIFNDEQLYDIYLEDYNIINMYSDDFPIYITDPNIENNNIYFYIIYDE